jgi:mannose-6-phosphate isomerase-like protein (cupin superfamily)
MESIDGATVVFPHPDGVEAEAERGPVNFGPGENEGAYVMMIGAAPKSEGPPLHIHPHTNEGFYVAAGELTVVLEGREIVATPGTFVYIPKGVVHTARNTGPGPMRGLIIVSPGTAEHIIEPV